MAIQELWVEKWRPKKIDDYVFRDQQLKDQLEYWIENKTIPNLLFVGAPGTGKSSAANILVHELGLHEYDVLKLNASIKNSIDDVRITIINFIQFLAFGEFKVVLLEEFDMFSQQAQGGLRAILEDYSNVARFVLTANFAHKILKPIHSRCQTVKIDKLDVVEYTARVATILMNENIDFDLDVLDVFVSTSYPDLRKCINLVQQYSTTGTLKLPDKTNSNDDSDWKLEMVTLFKSGKIDEARKLICGKITPDDMEEVYRWLYDNISIFGDYEKQGNAILTIKQSLVDHAICSDSEINLSACLIRLSRIYHQ